MPFKFESTHIPGILTIVPEVFPDDRGFFLESWKESNFEAAGIAKKFVQDNHSCSSEGVLRGLFFQKNPHAQGKLVWVVWDVGVDLRPCSKMFGQWFGTELTAKNHKMMYIPPGFAHGFRTLADNTHFLYKCTVKYKSEADAGIRWNNHDIDIKWPEMDSNPSVSKKNEELPCLKDIKF